MTTQNTLSTAKGRAALLKAFESNAEISYNHIKGLHSLGLLEREYGYDAERKARTVLYYVSGRGKGLLAMAENWN